MATKQMKTIYRCQIALGRHWTVALTLEAKILHFGVEAGLAYIWCEVELGLPNLDPKHYVTPYEAPMMQLRYFITVQTCDTVPPGGKYIGSVNLNSNMHHLYELRT